jgi:Tfp pilus assembly protein PilN
MIEINLLPGAKKGKARKSAGPAIDFGKLKAAIAERFKDVWLTAAIATSAVVLLTIGFFFLSHRRREGQLREREAKEVADSARYAVQLEDRAKVQARRDSALLQLSIIKAIDEDRFIWPHIMEEVSRTLPIYTWLRTLTIVGAPQGVNPPAAIKPPPPPDPKKKGPPPAPLKIPRDTVRMRLVGRTVDMQAFTRFMRTIEESPFLGNVIMDRTEPVLEGQKDLTQFTISVTYTRPDTLLLRRVPLTLSAPR